MVLDVAHLVAGHALELLAVHDGEQPGGEGDGRLVRADPGGEGVGRGVVDHVDGGLGDPLADGQGLHQVVQLRVLGRVGRHGPRDPEHQPGPGVQGVEDPADGQDATDHHADDDRAPAVVGRWGGRDAAVGRGLVDGLEEKAAGGSDGQPDHEEQDDEDDAASLVAGDLAVHVRILRHRRFPTSEQPVGRSSQATVPDMSSWPPAERTRSGLELMDEQGIDRAIMWPTLASVLEERLTKDPEATRCRRASLNEWMFEEWTLPGALPPRSADHGRDRAGLRHDPLLGGERAERHHQERLLVAESISRLQRRGFVDRSLDPVVTAAVLGSMTDRSRSCGFPRGASNATSTRESST